MPGLSYKIKSFKPRSYSTKSISLLGLMAKSFLLKVPELIVFLCISYLEEKHLKQFSIKVTNTFNCS